MNSTAMSLSDDQDSLHTARSIRDNVQSSFGNEAYGDEEGWHDELLPLPVDRDKDVHMYIPSS
jgi:hypothetical protein